MDTPTSTSKLTKLSEKTTRRIKSEQVVKDTLAAVKELIENALDANATTIRTVLKKGGLDSITVLDDGVGIAEEDYHTFAQIHYTSKISDFSDLNSLSSYGFRGEGLAAICDVSREVKVTTKTVKDKSATVLKLDKSGQVVEKETLNPQKNPVGSHGTLVSVEGLLVQHPVRRENMTSKLKDYSKKIYDMMLEYCIIHPGIKWDYQDGAKPPLRPPPCKTNKDIMREILGPTVLDNMTELKYSNDDSPFRLHFILPSTDCNNVKEVSRSTSERCFFYVNKRPVNLLSVFKLINRKFREHFNVKERFPIVFLHVEVASDHYDVNFEPDKRKVEFHDDHLLLKSVEEILDAHYPPKPELPKDLHSSPKKTTMDEEMDSESLISNMDIPSRDNHSMRTSIDDDLLLDQTPIQSSNNKKTLSSQEKRRTTDETTATITQQTPSKRILEPMTATVDLSAIQRKMKQKKSNHSSIVSDSSNISIPSLSTLPLRDSVIVGRLHDKKFQGQFIVRINTFLYCFDATRASEALQFRQLIKNHTFVMTPLPVPQELDESFGSKAFRVLLTRPNGLEKVLQGSGFDVKWSDMQVHLVGITKEIDLDIEDLKEIICEFSDTLRSSGDVNASLVRPKKVLDHFMAKVAEKVNVAPSFTDVKELLCALDAETPRIEQCPHQKPLLTACNCLLSS